MVRDRRLEVADEILFSRAFVVSSWAFLKWLAAEAFLVNLDALAVLEASSCSLRRVASLIFFSISSLDVFGGTQEVMDVGAWVSDGSSKPMTMSPGGGAVVEVSGSGSGSLAEKWPQFNVFGFLKDFWKGLSDNIGGIIAKLLVCFRR